MYDYTWACGRDIHTDTSDVLAAALPDLSCRRSSINASACPHKTTYQNPLDTIMQN